MKKHKKISSNHHCFAKILSTIIFGAKIQIVFDCSQTKCHLKLSDNSVCRVWIWVHHEHFSNRLCSKRNIFASKVRKSLIFIWFLFAWKQEQNRKANFSTRCISMQKPKTWLLPSIGRKKVLYWKGWKLNNVFFIIHFYPTDITM